MGYDSFEIDTVWYVLTGALLLMVAFVIGFIYLSGYLLSYNERKEYERKQMEYAEKSDRELITQAKNHHRNYPENFAKEIKKEHDFKVDFDINLDGAVVKTEVVYAD